MKYHFWRNLLETKLLRQHIQSHMFIIMVLLIQLSLVKKLEPIVSRGGAKQKAAPNYLIQQLILLQKQYMLYGDRVIQLNQLLFLHQPKLVIHLWGGQLIKMPLLALLVLIPPLKV
jgi:hypothetical protein